MKIIGSEDSSKDAGKGLSSPLTANLMLATIITLINMMNAHVYSFLQIGDRQHRSYLNVAASACTVIQPDPMRCCISV